MATSDLMHELEGFEGGRLDATLQTQIRDAIIKELDDKSADVQTIAVSWYACAKAPAILHLLRINCLGHVHIMSISTVTQFVGSGEEVRGAEGARNRR
jgi:hypothetical protein